MPETGKTILLSWEEDGEDYEWEDLTEELTDLIQKRNPKGQWDALSTGFGWLSKSGYKKDFRAATGSQLLSAVLPRTDCHFRIYSYGPHGLAINNVHHDSPTWGKEWYFLTPARSEAAEKRASGRQTRRIRQMVGKGSPSGLGGTR